MSRKTKFLTGTLIASLFSFSAMAEIDTSKATIKTLTLDFVTTQTTYSDSWVGGEAGSFNWVSNLNAFTRKYLGDKYESRNRLKLSYGQTLTQDEETKNWSRPTKSTDQIDFESVIVYHTKWYVDPYGALRLESQFYDGRNRSKKLFFSPLTLTESAGASRKLFERNKEYISSRLGLALKQVFTKSIIDTATLATDTESDNEAGLESVTDADIMLHKNIHYNGRLSLFKAFAYSKSDELKGTEQEDYWKAIDVNFENTFNASVTKIISVSLYLQFLYDKEITKKGRIKETLGLGFTFKML